MYKNGPRRRNNLEKVSPEAGANAEEEEEPRQLWIKCLSENFSYWMEGEMVSLLYAIFDIVCLKSSEGLWITYPVLFACVFISYVMSHFAMAPNHCNVTFKIFPTIFW